VKMDAFARAVDLVISVEGGYVDDPLDRGQATKFGISLRFAAGLGDGDGDGRLDLDIDGDGDVDADDIRLLALSDAVAIYRREFWQTCACDQMPAGLALLVFDCAVNQGQPTARRLLQAALAVSVDGILGPASRSALRAAVAAPDRRHALIEEFAARRGVHYGKCKQFDRYGLGWMRRLIHITATALETH